MTNDQIVEALEPFKKLIADQCYIDLEADCLVRVPGTALHDYMVSGEAWLADEHLLFWNASDEERFLYYMGEEDNTPILRVDKLSVYELDDESVEWIQGRLDSGS